MEQRLSLYPAIVRTQHFRRVLFAMLAGGGAHTLLCWVALQLGFYRGGGATFYGVFGIAWAGHILFIAFNALGFNRRLKDPAMIMPLMMWSTTVLLLSAFFVDQVRLCVMLIFFAIIQVGVFQASRKQFSLLAAYCSAGYAINLILVGYYWPEVMDKQAQWIQWGLFSTMVLGTVILAAEISTIRFQLARRNQQLNGVVERIHEMAVKDELTGFYRRRHAMELLQKACGQSARGAFSLAVAYLDLDHFKRINDTYGHRLGDQVLRRFASLVEHHLSDPDFVARLGGEEFMLVLPVSSVLEARQRVKGIIEALPNERFPDAPELTVTVSAGLSMRNDEETPEQLLQRADQALYVAKEQGRNRLVVAKESPR